MGNPVEFRCSSYGCLGQAKWSVGGCGATFRGIFNCRPDSNCFRVYRRLGTMHCSLVVFEIEEKVRGQEKFDGNINDVLLPHVHNDSFNPDELVLHLTT